ncbi:MAG: hypothetical protein ACRBFS_08635 [Aureispira sp.]
MVNQKQIEASLQPYLEALEPKRINYRRQIALTGFFCLAIVVLSVGGCYFLFSNLSEAVRPELANLFKGLCTFFPSILVAFIASQQFNIQKAAIYKAYQSLVRTEGYLPVFQEWNANLSYFPEQVINKEDLEQVSLLKENDLIKGDDYCEGTLEDGRSFRFSEIELLEEQERRDSDGYLETYHTPFFKGLFFVLEQTRPYPEFSDQLRLEARTTHLTTRTSSLKDFFKKSTTDILDADFEIIASNNRDLLEHHFAIDQTKQAYADQFPPILKERLIELKEALQNQLTIAFNQETCYVAVSHEGEFWDTPLHQSLKKPYVYQNLAWNFAHCFMILEEVAAMTVTKD